MRCDKCSGLLIVGHEFEHDCFVIRCLNCARRHYEPFTERPERMLDTTRCIECEYHHRVPGCGQRCGVCHERRILRSKKKKMAA